MESKSPSIYVLLESFVDPYDLLKVELFEVNVKSTDKEIDKIALFKFVIT